ncbi:MAG TPA: PCRF domain-containing protein, partial [Burkholderiales bacterium]|nr:PCRF domain-containing protein [Burkholderiales bacterium]
MPSEPQSSGGIFDFDAKQARLKEVAAQSEDPEIWNDAKRAQDLGRERKSLESVVLALEQIDRDLSDTRELFDLARAEDDEPALRTLAGDVESIEAAVSGLEFRRMFSNPMDPNNCFVDIQAGSGGTEAQ